MDATSYFLIGDSGTTHFRLRLVEPTIAIISELKTDQGIKAMNFSFLAQTELGRFDFFKTYLLAQIVVLSPIHPYQASPFQAWPLQVLAWKNWSMLPCLLPSTEADYAIKSWLSLQI